MVDRLRAVHRGAIISNRQGCPQLSIKANKQTDSDFYAIDIFIMTQTFCVLVLLRGPGGEPNTFKAVGKHAETMTAVGRTGIVLLFPKTVRLAGRKGEVQGCAILDAAIVFEHAANFNLANLGKSAAGLSATVPRRFTLLHRTSPCLRPFPMDARRCFFVYPAPVFQPFPDYHPESLAFRLQGPVSIHHAETSASHSRARILPGWMLLFLDNCCRGPNFFSAHL